MASETKTYCLEREVPLPRSKVWELLGNTEHFNQVIGLAPVQFTPVAGDDLGLVRDAYTRIMGIPMRWREYPFQWVKEERYTVLRLYQSGPLKSVLGGIELSDTQTQLADGSFATQLRVFADITPRSQAILAGLRLFMRRNLVNTFRYCENYLRLVESHKANMLPQPAKPPAVNATQLERLLKELSRQPVEQSYIRFLGDYLRSGADNEVASLRPYVLAGQWNAIPDEVLRLCLYATKSGILNLSWKMMCPNCRVPKAEYTSLGQLKNEFHCDLCGVTYSASFDRYVELRFAVHPQIRQATEQVYCIGGPGRTPQILIQQLVAKGQVGIIKFPQTDSILRLRVLRANHVVSFANDGELDGTETEPYAEATLNEPARAAIELLYRDEGWSQEQLQTPPPGTPIRITNRSETDITIALEKIDWDQSAVTAAKVTTMQEFRDLFSSEVLAPGQSVSIEHLTLFFSDLRDSTVLYEIAGDAPAYRRVRDHFDFLFERIQANAGSIVKTIGDAVMAVFYSPEDALRAAFEIQR
ncbi:MAG: adenylate/guanylate cyclase domain-containing protein, partial [Abitibacteriaceae bacterium]|nr:adenylate/guanylate cyclase domain-containing protein [Abditibacteriaceae bacterium]